MSSLLENEIWNIQVFRNTGFKFHDFYQSRILTFRLLRRKENNINEYPMDQNLMVSNLLLITHNHRVRYKMYTSYNPNFVSSPHPLTLKKPTDHPLDSRYKNYLIRCIPYKTPTKIITEYIKTITRVPIKTNLYQNFHLELPQFCAIGII